MSLRIMAAAAVAAFGLAGGAAAQTGARAFTFIGWGDVPYAIPGDYAKVDRLIAAMNRAKPVFSIHVGDVKAGNTPCSDEVLQRALAQIQTVEHPVIYSIGDNEWTDCHRADNGKFDPRERLAKLRQMYFPKPGQSLGKVPLAVESQALKDARRAKFVENQRFTHNGVMFVVPHIVGSNNGFEPIDPKAAEEFFERNEANVAWLKESFALAASSGASAVVVAFQANPYDTRRSAGTSLPVSSGFHATVREITAGAQAFAKPVLVIHGDQHTLELESFRDVQFRPVPNVLRLQLWGAGKVHAMRITVDPDMPGVFSFAPLIVPENGAF